MGMHLDLDDVTAGHPLAIKELAELRLAAERYKTAIRMTFDKWHKENEKYMEPADIVAWCETAWEVATLAEREACVNGGSMYSFEDVQYAWNASGAGFERLDFTDFIEHLGVKRDAPKEDTPEMFPGTLAALNKLGA